MAKNKAEQTEIAGMPSSELRDACIGLFRVEDKLGDLHTRHKEAQDLVKTLMRKEGKTTLVTEDPDGSIRRVTRKSVGETIRVVKVKTKEKIETK